MKRVLLGIVVVLLVAAYLAGFWPEHRRLTETEAQLQTVQQQLSEARAKIQLGEVLGYLLRLSDAVAARNYGQATTLSSTYFDQVRAQATRIDQPELKQALERILQTRDQVTAALARTDPSVATTLREQEDTLRRALGYPVEAPAQSPASNPP